MERTADIARMIAQAGLLVLAGPLVTGFIQKLKARLQCRQGASVWQPYRDLAKLLRKGTVQSDSASPFFRAVPVLVLAATVTSAAMLPRITSMSGCWKWPASEARAARRARARQTGRSARRPVGADGHWRARLQEGGEQRERAVPAGTKVVAEAEDGRQEVGGTEIFDDGLEVDDPLMLARDG